jgi:hypothetical protein
VLFRISQLSAFVQQCGLFSTLLRGDKPIAESRCALYPALRIENLGPANLCGSNVFCSVNTANGRFTNCGFAGYVSSRDEPLDGTGKHVGAAFDTQVVHNKPGAFATNRNFTDHPRSHQLDFEYAGRSNGLHSLSQQPFDTDGDSI